MLFLAFDHLSPDLYILRAMKKLSIIFFQVFCQILGRATPRMSAVVIFVLIGETALASSFLGILKNDSVSAPLQLTLMEPAGLVVTIDAKPELIASLRRLKTGDPVSATGRLNGDQTIFLMDSLERVGLQDILGSWQSPQKEIFEFMTFSQLNVYVVAESADGGTHLAHTKTLQYALTPEKDNRFSMFMTNPSGEVRMAFVSFENKKLVLILTDSQTGLPKQKFSLLPFSMR